MEIEPKKLVTGFILIFLLGVMFAIVNGIYIQEAHQSLPLIMYAISFISIILGGFLVVLFQWKINKVQLRRVLKILPEKEKKLITCLIEHNNTLEQNRLVALSGVNKVTVSRIIVDLEQRGIVKRTNLGNTKLIVLAV